MPDDALAAGDVVIVALGVHHPPGHEQAGTRPAVVVGVPPEPVRFPAVVVVPLTAQRGPWCDANPKLYPVLPAGAGALRYDSVALCDQVRVCDAARVELYLGTLPDIELVRLREGLAWLLP